jgi:quercetin dioxygenase-like cupin family protein
MCHAPFGSDEANPARPVGAVSAGHAQAGPLRLQPVFVVGVLIRRLYRPCAAVIASVALTIAVESNPAAAHHGVYKLVWTTADSSQQEQGTTSQVARTSEGTAARTPLILAEGEGERRIRRVMGGALAIIKVDRRNGGSPALMMGYEEIPPGQAIQAHRHPAMDEILFVHRGTGAAELGDRTATVGPGATIYIPQATRVMLRNTGTEPLAIAYFFPQPATRSTFAIRQCERVNRPRFSQVRNWPRSASGTRRISFSIPSKRHI